MSPKTGELIELCPWLKKSSNSNVHLCDIYHDRPDDCKLYPTTIAEMIRDECEMLEDKDFKNLKQAQKLGHQQAQSQMGSSQDIQDQSIRMHKQIPAWHCMQVQATEKQSPSLDHRSEYSNECMQRVKSGEWIPQNPLHQHHMPL